MRLYGNGVLHKTYGVGKVLLQKDSFIVVKFDIGIKKFKYPECFENSLTLFNDVSKSENIKPKAEGIALKEDKDDSIENFTSIEDFCDYTSSAISREILELKNNKNKKYSASDGVLISEKNVANSYIYSFDIDTELHFPNDTEISIYFKEEKKFYGNIVFCDEFNIVISTNFNMGTKVSEIKFTVQSYQILECLGERIEKLKTDYNSIVKDLVLSGREQLFYGDISKGQNTAIQMSFNQDITFIWGPPGTGKTETLAKMSIEHINLGHSVLMLSHSNVSVDGAILRIKKLIENGTILNGKKSILRYGYARDNELLESEIYNSYMVTLKYKPELFNKYLSYKDTLQSLDKKSEKYGNIAKEFNAIKKQIKQQESMLVGSADFVATTVSKAVMDTTIYNNKFDVVIFDEASMAYIPQIIFSANLAKSHFICIGDFCQLPPIVVQKNEKNKILKYDIFQYCGIVSAVNNNMCHKWLCMLDVQYRMYNKISDFVSNRMYNNLLLSGKNNLAIRKPIVYSRPFSGQPIALVDLSNMVSTCSITLEKSHINIMSACISVYISMLAFKYSTSKFDSEKVGIITPYNVQSRLINAIVRDIRSCPQNESFNVSVATVHSFQGSEKDVIIYDAVDCYRLTRLGIMLTDMKYNYANRLFNVAMTRAKGKFILVANRDYILSKNISNKLLFKQIINDSTYYENDNFSSLIMETKSCVSTDSCINIFCDRNATKNFLEDLSRAKKEAYINLPGHIEADEEYLNLLFDTLTNLKKNKIGLKLYAEYPEELPNKIKLMFSKRKSQQPISIIDREVLWVGQPLTNYSFVRNNEIIKAKHKISARVFGKHTAQIIYSLDLTNK